MARAILSFTEATKYPVSSLLVKDMGSASEDSGSLKLKVKVPHFDNSALIEGYSRTLLGRCMNPSMQDMKSLLFMLPRIWKVEERVAGADLGQGRFQLDFDREEDIQEIMKMEPFHFDYWMVSIVRWKPVVDQRYPSAKTFWVRVMGVPLHFWADMTFRSIGEALGEVKAVDLDNGKVQVVVDGFKPLCFETMVEFHSGEETMVTLRYERLFGFCRKCHSLCHEEERCFPNGKAREISADDLADGQRHGWNMVSYKGATSHGLQKSSESENKSIPGQSSNSSRQAERINHQHGSNNYGKGKLVHYREINHQRFEKDKRYYKESKGQKSGLGYDHDKKIRNLSLPYNVNGWNGRKNPVLQEKGTNQGIRRMEEIHGEVREKDVGRETGAPNKKIDKEEVLPLGDLDGTRQTDAEGHYHGSEVKQGAGAETELELGEIEVNGTELQVAAMGVEETGSMVADVCGADQEVVVEGQIGHDKKKKGVQGTTSLFPGACSKKRNVQTLISPRKKITSKNTVKIGEGLYTTGGQGKQGGHRPQKPILP